MNYIFIMYVIIHVFLLSELKMQDTEEDTKSTQSSVSTIQKDLQTLQVPTVIYTKLKFLVALNLSALDKKYIYRNKWI